MRLKIYVQAREREREKEREREETTERERREGKRRRGRLVYEPSACIARTSAEETRMNKNDFFSYPNKSFENRSRLKLSGKEFEPEFMQLKTAFAPTFLPQNSPGSIE